jgi:hypothetical protein
VKRRWASPFVAKIQQNNPTAIMGLTNGKTCAIIHTYAKQTGVNMNHDKLATLVGAGTIGLIGICAVSAVIGLGSLISTPAKSSSTPSVTAQPAPVAELTPEEKKQKEFKDARALRGAVLYSMIKKSAFDEDALKIKAPVNYTNGVCVEANGKNRFGAYVGWQEYCYLVDAKGEWKYSGPN